MCHRMGTRKCVKVFLAHFSSVVRLKAPVFSSYIIYHISYDFFPRIKIEFLTFKTYMYFIIMKW